MTSVQVISSAVARINCLKDLLNQSEKMPVEAEELQKGLEGIKKLLVAAHSRKTEAGPEFVDIEKQVVRLSYEIVDAIADASSFKPKETFAMSILHKIKTGNTKQLGELLGNLTDLHDKLQASTTGLEIKDPQNPEMIKNIKSRTRRDALLTSRGRLSIRRKDSVDNLKLMTKKEEIQEKSDHPPEEKTSSPAEPEPASGPSSEPKDLLNTLRDELLDKASASEVYLVGESGMGKTNLAQQLYNDVRLKNFFDIFAWVQITRNFQIKRVLQVLLKQLEPQMDMREMNETELIARIFAKLKNNKYMIVLKDINSMDEWESIRLALPIANSGRVIITTSANDIRPGKERYCYYISGLSKTDIMSLFKDATFKSERVKEAIFELSGGSPLYATILGKSFDVEASEQELVDELRSHMHHKGTSRVLEACYKRLAPELKPCLLYLSQFPQGQDIEVEKLYLLLVAENLLTQMESKISGSKSAADQDKVSPQFLKEYLAELARLKLVQLQEDVVPTMSGIYKSCKLHDQVRHFCRSKGSEEEFIQIMDFRIPKEEVGPHTRRLAIYLRGDKSSIKTISQATLKKLLALVVFDTSESGDQQKAGWPSELCDLSEMIRLRILNFDGIHFTSRKLPKGLEKLFLLRYLSFRGCLLSELPSSLSILTQLETLDLTVQPNCELVIPNNLFTNMTRMVHLYFPRVYKTISGKTKADVLMKLEGMTRLEILVNFNTKICDVEALSKLTNLKILSTMSRGNLVDQHINFLTGKAEQLKYSSVEITSFDCYANESVSALKKMLQCKFVHSINVEGRIGELPTEECGFAGTIGEIVLEGSQLMLDPMIYLGKFNRLHTLALSNDAFLGTEMLISLFPKLKRLKLKKLQFLEKVTIEKNAMPELSSLQIHSCGCLRELTIPGELDARLKEAQKSDGADAYSVIPFHSELVIKST